MAAVRKAEKPPAAVAPLFEAYALNRELTLPNRIVLAPCTRNCATSELATTKGAVAYYSSRADAGLLVTEATLINGNCQGYLDTPGIWSDRQIAAWRRVTDAVRNKAGRIFCQIWHVGRLAHPHYTGVSPMAPSRVPTRGKMHQTQGVTLYHVWPRALELEEITNIVEDFACAAANAKAAGFDGVEIHGANGYLPDQFLRQCTNNRTDRYGGSPSKRARFVLEVVEAVANVVGEERVGLRLSPAAYFGLMTYTEKDNDAYRYLIRKLNGMRLAYLHVGIIDDFKPYEYLKGRASEFLRQYYGGTLIGNGGYTPDEAAAEIDAGGIDLISFGRDFIANKDLVQRVRTGKPLRPYSRELLDQLR